MSFKNFITTSTKNTFTNLHIIVRILDAEPWPVMWVGRGTLTDFITSKLTVVSINIVNDIGR